MVLLNTEFLYTITVSVSACPLQKAPICRWGYSSTSSAIIVRLEFASGEDAEGIEVPHTGIQVRTAGPLGPHHQAQRLPRWPLQHQEAGAWAEHTENPWCFSWGKKNYSMKSHLPSSHPHHVLSCAFLLEENRTFPGFKFRIEATFSG